MKLLLIIIYFMALPAFSGDWKISLSPENPPQCASFSSSGLFDISLDSRRGFRCEFSNKNIVNYPWGTEHKIHFSISTDSNFVAINGQYDSVFQAWQRGDSCDDPARGTPFSIIINGSSIMLVVNKDSRFCGGFTPGMRIFLGTILPSRKYRFDIHVKWGWEDGFIDVKLNGADAAHVCGIGFNDASVPIYKFGIYAWQWKKNSPSPSITRHYKFSLPVFE